MKFGETYITIKIRRLPEDEKFEELKLLVDTGAMYSWIPKKTLKKLNVKAVGKRKFKVMSGAIVERELGYVFIEYDNEIAPTMVVFAEEGDTTVFGLHGMESLGLEIDPLTKQVKKSEALLALYSLNQTYG